MFRDRRGFRSIAFRSPKITGFDAILAFFPAEFVEKADQLPAPKASELELLHWYYYSKELYSSNEPYQKKINNTPMYRYNMYLIRVPISHSPLYFVAVPFLPLALEIYPRLKSMSRGMEVYYKFFDLSKLINAVEKHRNLKGQLRVTKIKYKIDGDVQLKSIVFRGTEVADSQTRRKTVKAIPKKGPVLQPEQVRLTVHKDNRLTVELEDSGHCKFWLSKDAANISALVDVWRYMEEQHMIAESASFPAIAGLQEEEEEEQDHE